MIQVAAFSALLLVMATPASKVQVPVGTAKFQIGQSEFRRGDFLQALRTLDAAASEANDGQLLGQIHLLRGQCLAARQDLPGAEEAFGLALQRDPEVVLDPSRVDPALVSMLDGLRARLRGELVVRADREGAQVLLDGRLLGQAPLKSSVSVGKHALEVRSPNGLFVATQDVVVRSKQTTEVAVQLRGLTAPSNSGTNGEVAHADDRPRLLADLRGTLDPLSSGKNVAFEVGGGVEYGPFRGSASAVIYPDFGLAFRGALKVPLEDKFNAYISLEIPIIFTGMVQFGLGGAGGAEYEFSRWFNPFFEVGVRHFFTGVVQEDPNRLILQFGIRLKVP